MAKKKKKAAAKKEVKRAWDDLRLDILEHFHPEHMNHGKWSIYLTQEHVAILDAEFKGTLAYAVDSRRTGYNVLVRALPDGKFTPEQTIIVLRAGLEVYKSEADRLYDGMKKLLEGP
jgi:hypothetical protein